MTTASRAYAGAADERPAEVRAAAAARRAAKKAEDDGPPSDPYLPSPSSASPSIRPQHVQPPLRSDIEAQLHQELLDRTIAANMRAARQLAPASRVDPWSAVPSSVIRRDDLSAAAGYFPAPISEIDSARMARAHAFARELAVPTPRPASRPLVAQDFPPAVAASSSRPSTLRPVPAPSSRAPSTLRAPAPTFEQPTPARAPARESELDYHARMKRCSRDAVEQALKQTGGNKRQAAKLLGVNRDTVYEALKHA